MLHTFRLKLSKWLLTIRILLIFHGFHLEDEDMPTGNFQHAEHDYDKHFAREHRFIDSIDFQCFCTRVGENVSIGVF